MKSRPGKRVLDHDAGVRAADRVVEFFGCLQHTKGKWAGMPFNLESWQEKEIIRPLFGTLLPDGRRQYRTAFIAVPRKNGKSELGAGIALYLLLADKEPGSEVYSLAADRDQASLVFNVAKEMVRRSRVLSERCKVVDSTKRIVVYRTASFYQAVSADVPTKHGVNPHGVIFDELHAQPNRGLWDVFTTSGGTRAQPLLVAFTTAGYDQNSICYEQYDYAKRILRGAVNDPAYFPYIREAGTDEDWFNEDVWKRANPALGAFLDVEEMRTLANRAKETPGMQNTFRRLRLNQWTQQDVRWLDLSKWDACAGDLDPTELEGMECYAGLDLASTTDIAALVLVFPLGDGYQVLPFFWVPEENLLERVRKDRVPYDVWERQGYVEATSGNVIDYGAITQKLQEINEKYHVVEIAYDRWGMTQLSQDLDGEGFTVVPFGQGFASMSGPTKELMNLVLARKIAHGGNPVLRWMADNMVVKQDPAGNLKPDKSKSREKIDGMVALVMALDRATRHKGQSGYEAHGIRSI